MKSLDAARERIARATDLSEVLDASYRAFATMLHVIQQEQDRGGPMFAAFMMAGKPATDGTLALLTAPSLPDSTRLTPVRAAGPSELTPLRRSAAFGGRSSELRHSTARLDLVVS